MFRFNLFLATLLLSPTICIAGNLSNLLKEAELIDPALSSAYFNMEASKENIPIARARLLPQINSSSTLQKSRTDTSKPSPSINNSDALNAQISMRQGLFKPRDWLGLSIGELQADSGRYKYQSAKSELWFRITDAWLNFLLAKKNVQTYTQALNSSEKAAQQALKRFNVGDGTRDYHLELKAQAELMRSYHSEAKQNYAARSAILMRLTGIRTEELNQWKAGLFESIHSPLVLSKEELKNAILTNNSELKVNSIEEIIAKKRLSQARYDHYPSVDLVASYARLENDSVATLGRSYTVGQYGIQLSIPIFAGGGLSATERQITASLSAVNAQKMALEQQITNQVDSDWHTYLGLYERIAGAQSLVEASAEARKSAQLGFQNNIKSWVDLGNADIQHVRRIVDLSNLQLSFYKAESKLILLLPTSHEITERWITNYKTR